MLYLQLVFIKDMNQEQTNEKTHRAVWEGLKCRTSCSNPTKTHKAHHPPGILVCSPTRKFYELCCPEFCGFLNVYSFILRERAHVGKSRGGTERQERKNPKQALRHSHRAQHRAWTHKPQDHDLSQNQESGAQPSHPGTPGVQNFYWDFIT